MIKAAFLCVARYQRYCVILSFFH